MKVLSSCDVDMITDRLQLLGIVLLRICVRMCVRVPKITPQKKRMLIICGYTVPTHGNLASTNVRMVGKM